ncbi:inositol-pentakisphosphate 2-kinase [Rhodocollybia butyracea]|uniref:Inositol-pentakisphosphate 2-kinase n=1 Tax=Rhodocollybia butyracea TaxID=206335 RepID=A0A9P5UEE7_9AGAR|nr:inositol-pentakisphosphate 2-kinase [Rhodocollybia butyracea]
MASTNLTATTSPFHWKYLSEGAATIVFTYTGPPNECFHDKVLRVRKGAAPEDEQNSVLFQTKIISRLLPQEHLVNVEQVSLLSKSWLETLANLCAEKRPKWRTDSIDLSRNKGLLAPNLVLCPISVEIKPKWSFLKPQTTQACRFCMHAACRGRATSYCPLDLFSSSPARVKKAIYALYDCWAAGDPAQNNFRLFINGMVSPPGTHNLQAILQRSGILSDPPILGEGELRDLVVETLHSVLVQPKAFSLLKTLNCLQRTLDGVGIQRLASLWTKVHEKSSLNSIPSFGQGCLQPTTDDWHSFVNEYLKRQNGPLPHTSNEESALQYQLLSYLLSATFKDCSIMIMLPGLLFEDKSELSTFSPRITVIDLDTKPIHSLQKWIDQDFDIVQKYSEFKDNEKKQCSDDWDLQHLQ